MGFAGIPQSYIQKCKILAHILQTLFIFVAGCITIAIFTTDGFIGGGTRWFFALCFITAPALVYLVMVPMWPRTVRFANVYAFFAVDAVFAIFWLSAFISVAMFNAAGIRQGAKDAKKNEDEGDCTTFAYGSERKCSLSRATVGLGAVVFIFFLLSGAISGYWAFHFRKTGETPFKGMAAGAPNGRTQAPDFEAPKVQASHDADNAWSADMHERRESDEYNLLQNTNTHDADTEDGRHPGKPINWGSVDNGETGYHGASGAHEAPSALSPGGYDDYRRSDAHTGNFNATVEDERDSGYNGYERYRDEQQRTGSGYSFSGGDNVRQS